MASQPHTLEERGWPDEIVRDLIRRARNGDEEARAEVIQANLRLVRSLVQRFAATGHDPDDLFQLGCIGLVKAVDRFDLLYDVRFSTYAVPLILGEIRRYLRDDGPMRVSRSLKALAHQARRTAEKLRGDMGREPSIMEIAREMQVEPDEVIAALDGVRAPASIYQTIHEGDGDPIFLLDKLSQDEGGVESNWLDRVALRDGLARLEGRERTVLMLRFFRDMTQTQVAQILGVSQVQVSRLERRALEQIRRFISTREA